MFEQALASLYPNRGFEHTAFQVGFKERRAKAVAGAMAGNPITAPAAFAAPTVPDL
jgi:hypothetical protein